MILVQQPIEIECITPGSSVTLDNGITLSNKTETSLPDIDYDISNCDLVKEKLIELWGENNVVYISNWNTLQLSSLLKDISKFYGISFKESNEITNKVLFEATPKVKEELGIKAGVLPSPLTYEQAIKHSETLQEYIKKHPQIEEHITNLFKQVKSASCFSSRCLVLTSNGEKLPEDLVKTDKIAFINKNKEIDFSNHFSLVYKGRKEIFSILIEDGYSIELTEDHKVLTKNGYKEVKNLTENDEIVVL